MYGNSIASRIGAAIAGILALAFAVGAMTLVLADREKQIEYWNKATNPTWEAVSSTEIAAMANSSEMTGTQGFFLKRTVEENVVRYTVKHDDGSFTLEKTKADGLTIFEIEPKSDEKPRIEVQDCTKKGPKNFNRERLWGLLEPMPEKVNCGSRTAAYVPKGSVVEDFAIDPANG